jgi:hypothetical protein
MKLHAGVIDLKANGATIACWKYHPLVPIVEQLVVLSLSL